MGKSTISTGPFSMSQTVGLPSRVIVLSEGVSLHMGFPMVFPFSHGKKTVVFLPKSLKRFTKKVVVRQQRWIVLGVPPGTPTRWCPKKGVMWLVYKPGITI